MAVRKINFPNNGGKSQPCDVPRVETGAVQFGDDWPGYFIRGDNAMYISMQIEILNNHLKDTALPPMVDMALKFLISLKEDIQENTFQ